MAMWHQVDLTIVHVRGLRKRGWWWEGGREGGRRCENQKQIANKVKQRRGDIMLKRRFACDAGVARVSCSATHLAASHASSGHPPP
jgi:hypothetical protein